MATPQPGPVTEITRGIYYGTLSLNRERIAQFFQNVGIYLYTPMVYDANAKEDLQGTRAPRPYLTYAVHRAKTFLSEGLFRLIWTAAMVLLMPNVLAGNLSFVGGGLAKGFVFGALFIAFGYHGAWGRFENLLVSWYPSSSRAFAPHNHIIPYADLIGTFLLAGSQIAFSVAGAALGLWVINATTLGNALPNRLFDTFGLVGGYTATTSDIWLVEFGGSAVITLVWLFVVVDFHGLERRFEAGVTLGLIIAGISVILFPITGENFDCFYFLAVMGILNAVGRTYGHHLAAYILATILGAITGWVLWMIVAGLDWHIIGVNPGIPKYTDAAGETAFQAPLTLQQQPIAQSRYPAGYRFQQQQHPQQQRRKGV